MKRRIAIFFVLLANIILLAHAAIPHHHFPYSATSNVQHVDVEHVHDHGHDHNPSDSDFNHHHHNDKDDYDHCLLNKVISITKNNVKSAVNSDIDFDFDFGYNFEGFQAIVPDFSFDWDIPIITINLKPHLFSSSYISYSSSVLGLRAPPVA